MLDGFIARILHTESETGVLIFILPLSVKLINIRYSIIIACLVATITVFDEIRKIAFLKLE